MKKPLEISEKQYQKMLDNLAFGYEMMLSEEKKAHRCVLTGVTTVLITLICTLGAMIYTMIIGKYVFSIILGAIIIATSITIVPMWLKENKNYELKVEAIQNLFAENVKRVEKTYKGEQESGGDTVHQPDTGEKSDEC